MDSARTLLSCWWNSNRHWARHWDGNFRFSQRSEFDSVSCVYTLYNVYHKVLNSESIIVQIANWVSNVVQPFVPFKRWASYWVTLLVVLQGVVGNLPPRKTWGTVGHVYLQGFTLDTRPIQFNYFLSRISHTHHIELVQHSVEGIYKIF